MALNSALSPVDGNKYFGATGTPPAKSELDMSTFLRLLTTQLANQNPLEPMNDRDFFAQMAQLGTVQGMDALKAGNEVQQANSLIGKRVVGVRPGGETNPGDNLVDGIVTGINKRQGSNYLVVKESNGGTVEMKMESVQSVSEASGTQSTSNLVALAQSAGFIGKQATAPHPTMKTADGKPLVFTAAVKSISFEQGTIMLKMTDGAGKDVKVGLSSVLGFSN
jgi:flagellar basal-body rod modification protein FlgD